MAQEGSSWLKILDKWVGARPGEILALGLWASTAWVLYAKYNPSCDINFAERFHSCQIVYLESPSHAHQNQLQVDTLAGLQVKLFSCPIEHKDFNGDHILEWGINSQECQSQPLLSLGRQEG
jgi:hypothetical protein